MSYINRSCPVTSQVSLVLSFARNQWKKRLPVAYPVYIYTLYWPECHLEFSPVVVTVMQWWLCDLHSYFQLGHCLVRGITIYGHIWLHLWYRQYANLAWCVTLIVIYNLFNINRTNSWQQAYLKCILTMVSVFSFIVIKTKKTEIQGVCRSKVEGVDSRSHPVYILYPG